MSSSRVFAVDSGAGHVACGVFTADKGGRLTLEQFALESFNPDATLEDQWNQSVAQSIGPALKREKISGAAAIALPGHLTLTKFVKTPAVEKSKRDKIIQFEAQQNIPYSLDEVVWDKQVVSEDGLDLEVLLGAVKLDVAEGLCAALAEVGAAAEVIAPSALTLFRAFKYNYPDAADSVLVINIGARSTHLLFIDKQRFFVRTIVLAGNTVTQAIAEELKQDFTHAESIKLQVLGGQSDLPESSPSRLAVTNASQGFISRLQLEITRSTVNYRRQYGAEQPACIYVAGGGSLIPDFTTALAEKVKLPVERFDPLRKVEISGRATAAKGYSAVLADLVGLATRLAVPTEAPFNLLPPSIGQAIAFRREQPFYVAAAVLFVAALAVPSLYFHQVVTKAKAAEQDLDTSILPLRSLKTANDNNLAKISEAGKQITGIQGLAESKSNWITFFTDLQTRLVKVEDVWLDKMQVLRPPTAEEQKAAADAAAAASPDGSAPAAVPAVPPLRLSLSGRLLDRKNPDQRVSQETYTRVKDLLKSFAESQFISAVENETFNSDQPGILSFEFILVVNPKKPL